MDNVIAPGAAGDAGIDPQLRGWAASRDIPVDAFAGAGGVLGFDGAITYLAQHTDLRTAVSAAKMIDYPTAHLNLSGRRSFWPGSRTDRARPPARHLDGFNPSGHSKRHPAPKARARLAGPVIASDSRRTRSPQPPQYAVHRTAQHALLPGTRQGGWIQMLLDQLSAQLACALLAGLAVFQVALIAGAPLGRMAWGGQHRVLPAPRLGSAASIPLYRFFA